MSKKRYRAEEIIHRLREADVLLSQGLNISQVCKKIGIADQTYYRVNISRGEKQVDTKRHESKPACPRLADRLDRGGGLRHD